MANHVFITVEGGVVQNVASTDPDTRVTLVDWDEIKGGHFDPIKIGDHGCDLITKEDLDGEMITVNNEIKERRERS
tara:strand:- start:9832 stop:10059 length:228 start_codon:yes stop_codon:yes gene_type:complete